MKKNRIKFPIILFVLLFGIVIGIYLEKNFSGKLFNENIKNIYDAISYIEKYYLYQIDSKKLSESAIKGILNDLDPHSVYLSAKEFIHSEETFRGAFEGIGIEFLIVNDTLTVISPIPGGPSEKLGILPGDRIIEIDDINVVGINNVEVRKKLRGQAGTIVSVTIFRPSTGKKTVYKITRDKIPIYSVDASFIYDNSIGYISLTRFSETTKDELLKALDKLNNIGMKKLILDLRGNAGGYLNVAIDVVDLFLDGEKIIVYTSGRLDEFKEKYFASKEYVYEKIPIVVLIDKGSASASEIVAGAIQDWDRGFIVGDVSFGKGLVQRQFELSDSTAIRLTVSEYFTPSGRNIQRNFESIKTKYSDFTNISISEPSQLNEYKYQDDKDSSKPVFKTLVKNRKVYGGGGITPDFIVKNKELSEFTQLLLKENLFYLFTLNYLDKNRKFIDTKFNNSLDKFKSNFIIDDIILKSFLDFISAKNILINLIEIRQDISYIKTRLKAEIAKNIWKNNGWYYIILEEDKQFKKAFSLLSNSERLIE